MQVTIVDYAKMINSKDELFFGLILEGDLEMVKSKETGRFYATARRAMITSTFSEHRCKQLIGKTMPGKIVKIACEAYEYTIPDSGEVIMLAHRYEYVPSTDMEQEVFDTDSIPVSNEITEF